MKRLPLYPRLPITPIETVERLDRNPTCTRCELSKGVETVCMPAMGAPGGVLVVGEAPGKREDQSGQPLTGAAGVWFAAQLAKHWKGPVAVANAIGCYPGKTRERAEVKVSVEGARDHVDACRPYLARVIEQVRPKRILVLGSLALLSVMGKALVPLKARRSYGWLFCLPMSAHLRDLEESNGQDGDIAFARALGEEADRVARGERPDDLTELLEGDAGAHAIPVFLLIPPAQAMRNRFVQKALEADLEWALTCSPELPPLDAYAEIAETAEDSQEAADHLSVGLAGVDVETGGIAHEKSFRVSSIAAARENRAFVWDQRALEDSVVSAPLRAYIESPEAKKIGAHFQYDLTAIHVGLGWRVRGVAGDVRLHRKLLDTGALGKLDEMVWLVGMGGMKNEAADAMKSIAKRVRAGLHEEMTRQKRADADAQLRAKGMTPRKWPKRPAAADDALAYWRAFEARDPLLAAVVRRQQNCEIGVEAQKKTKTGGDAQEKDKAWTFALLAHEERAIEQRYNALDALGTEILARYLNREFDREPEGLRITRDTIVDPAVPAIARLEEWGIPASVGAIQAFDSWLAAQLVPVMAKLAHYPVENWRSSQQIGKFLFGPKPAGLGLKASKQTSAGADSTGKDALEALRDAHPVIAPLLEFKRIMKLRDVYAGSRFPEGMLEHVREDGRIHCTVFLDGAETGRASASNGLHQIPGKKFPVEGKMARDCFPAPPGKVILSVDFGQVELRRAADESGDPEMIAIFKSGVDYHLRTAQLIAQTAWGISPEEVGDEHRAKAKNVNFGLIYGRGDRALACEMFHTQKPTPAQIAVAAKIRTAILGRFKVFAAWIKARHKEVRETGEVWVTRDDGTRARRRRLWDIASGDDYLESNAQNASQNTPLQGKASDDLLRSLIRAVEWIDVEEIENDVKVVLPVHDQMLFEVTAGPFVDDVADTVIPIMEGWPSASGLIADLEIGPSWGSLRKMKRTPEGWKCFIHEEIDATTGARKSVYSPAFRSAWAAYDFATKAAEVARERA